MDVHGLEEWMEHWESGKDNGQEEKGASGAVDANGMVTDSEKWGKGKESEGIHQQNRGLGEMGEEGQLRGVRAEAAGSGASNIATPRLIILY